jgi:hypothetical protein
MELRSFLQRGLRSGDGKGVAKERANRGPTDPGRTLDRQWTTGGTLARYVVSTPSQALL